VGVSSSSQTFELSEPEPMPEPDQVIQDHTFYTLLPEVLESHVDAPFTQVVDNDIETTAAVAASPTSDESALEPVAVVVADDATAAVAAAVDAAGPDQHIEQPRVAPLVEGEDLLSSSSSSSSEALSHTPQPWIVLSAPPIGRPSSPPPPPPSTPAPPPPTEYSLPIIPQLRIPSASPSSTSTTTTSTTSTLPRPSTLLLGIGIDFFPPPPSSPAPPPPVSGAAIAAEVLANEPTAVFIFDFPPPSRPAPSPPLSISAIESMILSSADSIDDDYLERLPQEHAQQQQQQQQHHQQQQHLPLDASADAEPLKPRSLTFAAPSSLPSSSGSSISSSGGSSASASPSSPVLGLRQLPYQPRMAHNMNFFGLIKIGESRQKQLVSLRRSTLSSSSPSIESNPRVLAKKRDPTWNDLPFELRVYILSFLPGIAVLPTLCSVSHEFRMLALHSRTPDVQQLYLSRVEPQLFLDEGTAAELDSTLSTDTPFTPRSKLFVNRLATLFAAVPRSISQAITSSNRVDSNPGPTTSPRQQGSGLDYTGSVQLIERKPLGLGFTRARLEIVGGQVMLYRSKVRGGLGWQSMLASILIDRPLARTHRTTP